MTAKSTSSPAPTPLVGVIMGSSSDWEVMKHAVAMLDDFGVPCEARVISAHRMPLDMAEYGAAARGRGLRAIIAGAGGAAHLPGMLAALTEVPVFGVPVPSKYLRGEDSLLSIVQMPKGVPVATFAIGEAGAANAALHVIANLATTDEGLHAKLMAFRARQTQTARAMQLPPPGSASMSQPNQALETRGTQAASPAGDGTLPAPVAGPRMIVEPGGWLGLLGGGQLGRMFCHAAQSLGYKVAVLDPAADGPAAMVADRHIQAGYDDPAGLDELARICRAVTTEFENVPADSLRALAARCRVSPAADAVAVVQDRIAEKAFIAGQGILVAPHAAVRGDDDLRDAPDTLFPGILKVARLGYDGKGQARVQTREQALAAFEAFGRVPCVLEALMPLDHEISVVIARGFDGATVMFPVARNVHRDGILAVSTVDRAALSGPDAALERAAGDAALRIAAGLDYHGVLCVEFFVLRDGSLLVNEIAPRPHNSGHYSIDACVTSQFEQQARAMAGLPLGAPDLLAPAVMLNILGDIWYPSGGDGQEAGRANGTRQEAGANGTRQETSGDDTQREPDWDAALAVPSAKLHLYGKRDARRGRKMGHVTIVAATMAQARRDAAGVAAALGIPAP